MDNFEPDMVWTSRSVFDAFLSCIGYLRLVKAGTVNITVDNLGRWPSIIQLLHEFQWGSIRLCSPSVPFHMIGLQQYLLPPFPHPASFG